MNFIEYPASTVRVNGEKLAPSSDFRKQVGKVVSSIVLFFIVYILLVLAAVVLAAGCFYLGFHLIVFIPKLITIVIGLGLMALGISVVIFLFKFIFASSKKEDGARIEIREAEQPQLFSFIRQLAEETKTPFPKKIFLSAEVNASVFYDSGFWSMFLPVRKNLLIGMGLVNSVNVSEFKAVMAHEFGHFSQRSMKLGSFTYNVNKVIYNMLYENTGYASFLNSWGNLGNTLSFFAGITVKIATGIQWILRGMYRHINKNYLGLSRQMEFHADAVSASVSGGNNLVAALSRLEIASGCYHSALDYADRLLREHKVCTNIFENHLTIMQTVAKEYDLPLQSGIPEVSFRFIDSFSKSRVNYKDQWASHPTLADRKKHLDAFNVEMLPNETGASLLFANHQQLQQRLTENLYKSVNTGTPLEPINGAGFADWYAVEKKSGLLPDGYRGFYDKHVVDNKDWDMDKLSKASTNQTFDTLFSEENAQLASGIEYNKGDLETVKAIHQKELAVESFDFDGRKYHHADCAAIIKQLEDEIAEQTEQLASLDKEAYVFFYNMSGDRKDELKKAYENYKLVNSNLALYMELANAVFEKIQPFYTGNISIEEVHSLLNSLKEGHEKDLKRSFKELIREDIINEASNGKLQERMENFIRTDYAYFIQEKFEDLELQELKEITIDVANALGVYRFGFYKRLLELQLGMRR